MAFWSFWSKSEKEGRESIVKLFWKNRNLQGNLRDLNAPSIMKGGGSKKVPCKEEGARFWLSNEVKVVELERV